MVSVAPLYEGFEAHLDVAATERVAATKLEISDLTIRYGSRVALSGVNL